MFCNNCGTKLGEEAVFCTNCGQGVRGGNPNMGANTYAQGNPNGAANTYAQGNNVDAVESVKEGIAYIKEIAKNPMGMMASLKTMKNATCIAMAIVTALIGVAEFYMIKSAIAGKIAGGFGNMSVNYALQGQNGKIVIGLLMNNLLLLATVAGVIFLAVNQIFKKFEFKYMDGLKISVAAYAYTVVIILVGALATFVSAKIGLLIIFTSIFVNILLLFKGIVSYNDVDENKGMYISSVVVIVGILVQYICISALAKSVFMTNISGFLDTLF